MTLASQPSTGGSNPSWQLPSQKAERTGARLGPTPGLGRGLHLTCGRRAREARAVPCEDGIHASTEPVQRLDAREATEDPPDASEFPSGLGHRAVSAVSVVVSVDPPRGLRDRLGGESHRRWVIDELPWHHADPGWKAPPGDVRSPRAEPAISVEDQGGLSFPRVRQGLLHTQ
jgi:hypothetical protein